jgi:hypothetical protein
MSLFLFGRTASRAIMTRSSGKVVRWCTETNTGILHFVQDDSVKPTPAKRKTDNGKIRMLPLVFSTGIVKALSRQSDVADRFICR